MSAALAEPAPVAGIEIEQALDVRSCGDLIRHRDISRETLIRVLKKHLGGTLGQTENAPACRSPALNGAVHWMLESPNLGAYPFTPPSVWVSLPVMYLLRMVVVLMLYPICSRFASVKQRRNGRWPSYL